MELVKMYCDVRIFVEWMNDLKIVKGFFLVETFTFRCQTILVFKKKKKNYEFTGLSLVPYYPEMKFFLVCRFDQIWSLKWDLENLSKIFCR
jgi:hypothetical protein